MTGRNLVAGVLLAAMCSPVAGEAAGGGAQKLSPLQEDLRCEVWLSHELAEGRYPPAGSTTSRAAVEAVIAFYTEEAESRIEVGGEAAEMALNAERYRFLTALRAAEAREVGLVLSSCMVAAQFILYGGFDFELWELADE